ncbi:hypothetical protein E8L90_15670 [Brevibacillus antibioticus]|uniref:TIGR02677 family protein n=1 Tax=Brevibacillus antibioticus TaxID=2570228 RepID=A0A4V5TIW2_9BACL|nr:Wadjet anti-phage system protein JetA family protein [Brevibacillus antibioticus]TKI56793.1 hypothetical protein E8L90_15670 [Brevibacillus antibioticus]
MTLFDQIPQRLFSVLASPGKIVFSETLFIIYRLFRRIRFIPREVVVQEIIDYLSKNLSVDELVTDLGEDVHGDDRLTAQALLRRLREDEWIDFETLPDYQEYITLRPYAEQILEVLESIRLKERTQYAGYIYSTHAALNAEDSYEQGLIALNEAYNRTSKLMRGLTSLLHNIRHYTEKLISTRTTKEILEGHFDSYKEEILDQEYHQLRTSDHVSKYRPQILETIERWANDTSWINDITTDLSLSQEVSKEEAFDFVMERLEFIRSSYFEMDTLLNDIDRRNAQYAKASLERVRYRLNSSEDAVSKLKSTLNSISEKIVAGELNATIEDSIFQTNFKLYPVQTLETSSIYKPREYRKLHESAEIFNDEPNIEDLENAQKRAQQRFSKMMTYKKVEAWIANNMGDINEARASNLRITTTDDLVHLVHLAAWGKSKYLGVIVDYIDEDFITPTGEFMFKNISIKRR